MLTEDGITIMAMDSSHISLINCFIPCTFFDDYNIPKNIKIGINLSIFNKILSQLGKYDELNIVFFTETILITFIGSNFTKMYEMNLITIDEDELIIPDEENITQITIPSKQLYSIIKDFIDIDQSITLEIKNKCIILNCAGEMTKINMFLEHENGYTIRNETDMKLSYTTKHIHDFVKGHPLCEKLNISIGENTPLKLSYNCNNNVYIRYYIAPKIEEDY